jgi:hypothetical protein
MMDAFVSADVGDLASGAIVTEKNSPSAGSLA